MTVEWKAKPSDIDEIIHKCKSALQLTHGIEMMSKKLRSELSEQLEKIEDIILNQLNNNH